jgi:hypothetical protein
LRRSRSRDSTQILNLHLAWIIARKTNGVIYICGDEEGCRRVERTVQRVGPYRTDRQFRIETLDDQSPDSRGP